MRAVSDKSKENQNTHSLSWHTHFACWVPKATDTHSECVILLQQWLRECAAVLRYSYIARLV